jgi:hypothetical protein
MNIFASVLDFRVMSPTEKQNHDDHESLRLRLTCFRKIVTIDKFYERETTHSSVKSCKKIRNQTTEMNNFTHFDDDVNVVLSLMKLMHLVSHATASKRIPIRRFTSIRLISSSSDDDLPSNELRSCRATLYRTHFNLSAKKNK